MHWRKKINRIIIRPKKNFVSCVCVCGGGGLGSNYHCYLLFLKKKFQNFPNSHPKSEKKTCSCLTFIPECERAQIDTNMYQKHLNSLFVNSILQDKLKNKSGFELKIRVGQVPRNNTISFLFFLFVILFDV